MRKLTITAIAFSVLLTGCSSYPTSSAYHRSYADPRFCSGKDGRAICAAGIGAAAIGGILLLRK